ncbi:hypothetical protein [Marinimicrobium agarilyticum]|uniref:hypothetical protein n=1 Tax=Marinimicrobium agarilyticum TaxID=306546 RepID=UPI0004166DB7|nr:hypothetical protein [Marinimicrobium agarilyticum]
MAPIPPDSPQHSAAIATNAVLNFTIVAEGVDLLLRGELKTIQNPCRPTIGFSPVA